MVARTRTLLKLALFRGFGIFEAVLALAVFMLTSAIGD